MGGRSRLPSRWYGATLLAVVVLGALEAHPVQPRRSPAPDVIFSGVVERVSDGDTVVFSRGVCRLLGIDAPERAQPLGVEAARALQILLGDHEVLALAFGKDKYGRLLCVLVSFDGALANMSMVESGLALVYMADTLFFRAGLEAAEARAKADRRGLWKLPLMEPPWVYRARVRGRR